MHRTALSWLLVGLTLVGLALRLGQLGFQPLWWDEGYSLFFATEPLPRLLSLTSLDIHPPLYYLLLQGWMHLTGIGVIQARLLSVLCGVIALPLFWAVARRLVGAGGAVAATALFVAAPLAIFYAQEVRMYALLLLLALGVVWALLRAEEDGDPRWRWGVAVGLTLAIHTHYFAIFLALAVAVAVLWPAKRRGGMGAALRRWVGPAALSVALSLPWFVYTVPRLIRYVGAKVVLEGDAPLTPLAFPWRHLVAFSLGHLLPEQAWLAPGALLFLALAVVGCSAMWRRSPGAGSVVGDGRHALLAAWLAVPLLGAFLLNLWAPFVDQRIERQLLFAAPPLWMVAGQGIAVLWARRRVLGVAALALPLLLSLLSLSGFYRLPRYPEDDYRPVLAEVAARQRPGDGWLAIYPWQVGYLRAMLPATHPTPIEVPLAWGSDPAALRQGVATLLARHPRLWLPAFQVKGRLFEDRLAAALALEGVPVWNEWYGNTRLWLAGEPPGAAQPTDIPFEGGPRLIEMSVAGGEIPSAGGIVSLALRWEGPLQGLRASVQLTAHGHVWGEWDGPLRLAEAELPVEALTDPAEPTTRLGLPVDAGTPPGRYTLALTVYRAADGSALPVTTGERRQVVPLGEVTVVRPSPPADPLALPAPQRLALPLGDDITLVGATTPEGRFLTGDRVPLTLFWQARTAVNEPLLVFVQAVDTQGQPWGMRDIPPVEGTFPMAAWEPGDLVRDPHGLPIAADAPAGEYRVIAGLYNPETGVRRQALDGRDAVLLGTITVESRPHQFEAPPLAVPLDARLGTAPSVRLAGLTAPLPAVVKAGDSFSVELAWQPDGSAPVPWRAFVQLLAPGDQLGGVSDQPPGSAPTTAWVAGEWIADQHTMTVAPTASGDYRVIAGLYDPATGQRLRAADGSDIVVLGTVRVEGASE